MAFTGLREGTSHGTFVKEKKRVGKQGGEEKGAGRDSGRNKIGWK